MCKDYENNINKNEELEKENISLEDLLKEKTFALDWYISPEECLKYGIATEII